jgi:hypothetical protein
MRLRTLLVATLGSLALTLAAVPATAQESPSTPPEWFRHHMEFMTRDGGRWLTDNAAYKSEGEPFDAYGLEWTWGLGKQSLKGRLFGLKDGKEVATFWEFRVFWHPGEGQVWMYQFGGNGVVGAGTMESRGGSSTRSTQQFFQPDGSRTSVGHETEDTAEGHHVTRSFKIAADGTWKPDRTYTWKRAG